MDRALQTVGGATTIIRFCQVKIVAHRRLRPTPATAVSKGLAEACSVVRNRHRKGKDPGRYFDRLIL